MPKKFKIKVDGFCKECGKDEKPHKAHGFCTTCYGKHFMRKKRKDEKGE